MKKRILSILLAAIMVLSIVPFSAITALAAGGTEKVDFSIKEKWGVCFEQTGSNKNYPIVLTNENKLSVPLPTLYRTDSDDYIFDGWYIADSDTKVTQDTVFNGYTIVVDRWTFQEKDNNTVISNIRVNNVALEAGMTTAEYNAAVQGATATVNGAPANAITADSAKTYTIYHGLNKSGAPLEADEEVEVGQDYSVVTKIKLADGYTFSPNITFISDGGMCASERFLGGADIYTREWNTLATEIEMTINFMNTDYYFDQTPQSTKLENYTQYKNWYTVSKHDGLESVTLQYESGGEWAVFIDNVPFEANGEQAGGYVTVSPYLNTTKTFRLVANYTQGKVYSEPFEISWACLTPVIENVVIGVTAPVNGFAPQYTATTDSNRYTFKSENAETVQNGIKWTGSATGELAVSGSKFNNDNDYTVSIKLVAQDGYTFANSVTATINANNADVNVVSETEIRVSYTFPKPEKPKWFVNFSNPGGYASGTMQPVQIEEGEYTLPEPTYTPYSGYEFVGWSVNGELKQPGDVITVSDNRYIEARWQSTVNDSPKGFTKQPPSKSTNESGGTAIAGIGYITYSFADDLTIDPSIDYEYISVEFYDAESGEWVAELDGVNANYDAFNPTIIRFNSNKAGTFTCRICAKKTVGGNMAISEPFTVTWAAKQFTTQPQGDMVVVGDTVTVTADKNFYVEKYEIEYKDGAEWQLYQEKIPDDGWGIFSLGFTSDAAKSVTFRIKAYAEGDVYDEENDCFPIVLIDTSEEFTITWTSNEHVHTYGAIPNGKDETNHWKECTDPACPDKAHSKIEVEAHKDNTADNKCDVCGYDLPILGYTVKFDANGGSGTMLDETEQLGGYVLPECTFTAPTGMQFKCWAEGSALGAQYAVNDEFNVTDNVTFYAIWENIPAVPTGLTASYNGTILAGNKLAINQLTVKLQYSDSSEMPCAGLCEYWYNGSKIDDPINYVFGVELIGTIAITVKYQGFETTFDVQVVGYEITFNANTGSGTMESVGYVGAYTLPACTFTAPTGKQFKGWSTSASGEVIDGTTYNVTANVEFFAIWENIPVPTFTITASAGANGSISPSGDTTVAQGANQTYTITANSGYHIKDVKVNGSSVGAVATYTFTNVTANATIAVEFEVDTVPHVCNPTLVPEDEPDCTTAGKSAYYHCECGKNYEDAQGNTEIENIETWGILNALNHEAKDAWSSDADNHWKECVRCAGQQLEKAAHADTDNNGKCDVCEYQISTAPNNPDNPNNTPADPSDDKDGLGAGAIVGIVIGSAAVAGSGGFTLLWFVIKKKSFADLIAVFKK